MNYKYSKTGFSEESGLFTNTNMGKHTSNFLWMRKKFEGNMVYTNSLIFPHWIFVTLREFYRTLPLNKQKENQNIPTKTNQKKSQEKKFTQEEIFPTQKTQEDCNNTTASKMRYPKKRSN